ncbi:hypothetical protein VPH35_119692 [Triticum aestivum]
MAPDRADEASPRPDPPPPQQPLSLPLPDPDRRRRLPPHRSPVVSHRPSTPAVSLSLTPNPDPNLRLSVLHPDPDPRWRPPIQPLPSSSTARARVQRPESRLLTTSSIPERLCLPVPPEDSDDTSSVSSVSSTTTDARRGRSRLQEKKGGAPRKEEVITREYTVNLHKRLHGWYASSQPCYFFSCHCRHAKPAGGCFFRGKEEGARS